MEPRKDSEAAAQGEASTAAETKASGSRRRPMQERLQETRVTLYRIAAEAAELKPPQAETAAYVSTIDERPEVLLAEAAELIGRAERLLPAAQE